MNHLHLLAEHITEIITRQWPYVWVKIPVCIFMGIVAFLFGIENGSILLALTILVLFDMVMGVAAAYVAKEAIQSRKILKTASKLFVYAILCSGAYLTEMVVPLTTFMDEAMISFLALTELVSLMENAGKMGFQVPQKLLGKLRDKIKET